MVLTQEFQGRILSVVYWSLGIVVTLAILLVGFGWWANIKIYERDKEAFRSEIDALVKAELSAATATLAQTADTNIKAVEEKAKVLADTARRSAEQGISAVRGEVLGIQFLLKKAAADEWIKKGVWLNVVVEACEMVDLAKQYYRSSGDLATALELLLDALKKVEGKRAKVEQFTIMYVENSLRDLPKEYHTLAQAVRQALVSATAAGS